MTIDHLDHTAAVAAEDHHLEGDEQLTTEFSDRLFGAMLGTFDVLTIAVGDHFGLYEPLAERWLTSQELAERTGMHERYAREWLEQQCASGILEVDSPALPARERRFFLPAAKATVLADREATAYLTPFARVIASGAAQLEPLLEAYRTGTGVSWETYGASMRTGQGDANRALFLTSLAQDWIPGIPGAAEALQRGGTALDVGCGEGWSTIALALGFPQAQVVGVDVDEASVLAAREHAQEYGVADRVTFRHADAGDLAGQDVDLALAFECVHDLPDPVSVLRAMRAVLPAGGLTPVLPTARQQVPWES